MYICYHYKLDLSGLAKTENCYKGGKGTSCKLAPAKVKVVKQIAVKNIETSDKDKYKFNTLKL